MALNTNAARFSDLDRRPQLAIARIQARHVNLLTLAQEMSADPQLHQALQVSGTALLGVATDGVPLMIRLASPDVTHVLISGTKASGKTEMMRSMLASVVMYQKPRDIQLLLLDPQAKAFEFLVSSPHLLGNIATTSEQGLQHLRWLENELERREHERVTSPRLVVAIDDLSEFVQQAGREFQVHLARLAQNGRRAGISLLVSNRQANGSDLSAAVRASFPIRLIGKQAGGTDGADKLAGRGDFILVAGGERVRFQAGHLAPEDLPAFYQAVKENHAAKSDSNAGLGGLVKRLRRVK